jgi:REP element-mobilizing transposase RayT
VGTAALGCPKAFDRRQLPHLRRDDKQHFVTFCTDRRWILPERVPSIVLECCLRHNGTKFDLGVAVVMPDHVPMIFAPLVDQQAREVYSLAAIMDAVKGASAHTINKMHRRKGRVWQAESFDRVLRSSENLDAKIIYLPENPVRAGIVEESTDDSWLGKKAFVNPFPRAPEQ